MRRPWLFQIGPIVVPTEAREEMAELGGLHCSLEQYLENVWKQRYPFDPARKSSDDIWPLKVGANRLPVETGKVIGMKR